VEEENINKPPPEMPASLPQQRHWNLFKSANFQFPIYAIGAGITAGIALGSAILFSLHFIKPK